MQEAKLQVFIDGASRYFAHLNDSHIDIGTPYLAENQQPEAYECTGIIGISGPQQGCVYFSAPKVLLRHLLMSLGESDTSDANMIDLVGEVANTISGNARSEYGSEFVISVPLMIEGAPDRIHLPSELRSYVIPIYWKSYSAVVVICLR